MIRDTRALFISSTLLVPVHLDFIQLSRNVCILLFSKVARGGCMATPELILQLRGGENRSFYAPADRREIAIGFRTCALD